MRLNREFLRRALGRLRSQIGTLWALPDPQVSALFATKAARQTTEELPQLASIVQEMRAIKDTATTKEKLRWLALFAVEEAFPENLYAKHEEAKP